MGNEYNELTVIRWVFFDLTLFFTGFLLVYYFLNFSGVGWQDYSRNCPYLFTEVDNIKDNRVIKFFLDISMMMIVGLISYSKL